MVFTDDKFSFLVQPRRSIQFRFGCFPERTRRTPPPAACPISSPTARGGFSSLATYTMTSSLLSSCDNVSSDNALNLDLHLNPQNHQTTRSRVHTVVAPALVSPSHSKTLVSKKWSSTWAPSQNRLSPCEQQKSGGKLRLG